MSQDELLISNLEQANLHFGSRMFDADNIINLLPGGVVKAVYEEKPEWESKKPLSIILRKESNNGLGFIDNYYYYLIFRKRALFKWSDTFNFPRKHQRTAGIYLPFAILKHIDNNGLKMLSEIVLIFGSGRIYKASSEEVFKFFISNKMQTETNYNQIVTGLPLSLFQEIK